MLASNDHVILISMDYIKAFDPSIRNATIADVNALSGLGMSGDIHNIQLANWIPLLQEAMHGIGRLHFNGDCEKWWCCPGISIWFIVGSAHLHQVFLTLKYADDSYVLIGSHNADAVQKELRHISSWATEKYLPISSVRTMNMSSQACRLMQWLQKVHV